MNVMAFQADLTSLPFFPLQEQHWPATLVLLTFMQAAVHEPELDEPASFKP